ncbi:MAG: hypothetical protein ACWGQW_08040, partial [bacterium]
EFDPNDPLTKMEIATMGAGFPLTRVTREQQKRWNRTEHAMFYQARRSIIKEFYVNAKWIDPDEGDLKAAEAALSNFNATCPPELKISRKELADFRDSRKKTNRAKEEGRAASRKLRKEYERINQAWDMQGEPTRSSNLPAPSPAQPPPLDELFPDLR